MFMSWSWCAVHVVMILWSLRVMFRPCWSSCCVYHHVAGSASDASAGGGERRQWRAQAVASAGSGSNASAANGSEVNIRVFCVIRFRFRFRFRFRCGAGYQDNVRGRFSIACTHEKHLHVGAHCITSPLPLTCPLFGCVFSSLASLEFTGFGAWFSLSADPDVFRCIPLTTCVAASGALLEDDILRRFLFSP